MHQQIWKQNVPNFKLSLLPPIKRPRRLLKYITEKEYADMRNVIANAKSIFQYLSRNKYLQFCANETLEGKTLKHIQKYLTVFIPNAERQLKRASAHVVCGELVAAAAVASVVPAAVEIVVTAV